MIKCIESAGKAGMRGINYNFCVLGHQSTESTKGRGGVSYRTFKLDEYDNDTLSKAGVVSRDEVFARAKYARRRTSNVCQSSRLAASSFHPHPFGEGFTHSPTPSPGPKPKGSKRIGVSYEGFLGCFGHVFFRIASHLRFLIYF